MKRILCLLLALTMTMFLAACNSENQPESKLTLEESKVDFVKTLEPIEYIAPDAGVTSSYYQSFSKDGETFYRVQPAGEEIFDVPVEKAVIYSAEDGESTIEQLTLILSNGQELVQYRINIPFETGAPSGDNATAQEELLLPPELPEESNNADS